MKPVIIIRSSLRTGALLASFGFLAIATGMAPAASEAADAQAAGDRTVLRVAPGRVVFTMSPDGQWKTFGLRGERALVKSGGVRVFAQNANGNATRIVDAAGGDTRSVLSDPISLSHDGARGGERYPSSFPDDDRDGRVDEDPLDGVDNDHDGSVDEDFAAVGDEMTVTVFAARNDRSLTVRQECYGWSLAHIDAMVASAVTVHNASHDPRIGVRITVVVETEQRMTLERAPQIENSRWNTHTGELTMQPVVLRGTGDGATMALVLFAPRTVDGAAWEIQEDHSSFVATSPSLGDLAPDGDITVYVALMVLPDDDLKVARAIHATARTVLGDESARFIPPPVPVTAPGDGQRGAGAGSAPSTGSGMDAFWNTPGRLRETLVVGSPNPFHDAIAIDYEVPERVVDEDGMEHMLTGASVSTSVKVYNVTGRLVATLVDTEHAPGRYRTGWTAHNDTGENVASGVYYVKLTIGKRSVTQRLVQLK